MNSLTDLCPYQATVRLLMRRRADVRDFQHTSREVELVSASGNLQVSHDNRFTAHCRPSRLLKMLLFLFVVFFFCFLFICVVLLFFFFTIGVH